MKTLKTFVPVTSPLIKVLVDRILQTVLQEVLSIEESDFVMVTGPEELRDYYCKDKFFFYLVSSNFEKEIARNYPSNFLLVDGQRGLDHIVAEIMKLQGILEQFKPVIPVRIQDQSGIAKLSRSYFVLVIDDSDANLQTAAERLPGQKLILAKGPEEAMKYLNLSGEMPDAVLTDMQMRPDRMYPSLDVTQYGVAETIHSGFAVMFEATVRGIPVAIVTEGNYHQDWVSAMFSRITSANVNGQKVLFFNNIGKRWDTALKMLLEPDESVQE